MSSSFMLSSALILAGGQSRRMHGKDKAFLMVEGRSIIERQLNVLSQLTETVFVSSGHPSKFTDFSVQVTSDYMGRLGPMDGIVGAMDVMETDWLWVVACDMPWVSIEILRLLKRRVLESTHTPDFVVPMIHGETEPLCALYHQRCFDVMKNHLKEKRLSMRKFCKTSSSQLNTVFVNEADLRRVDPELRFKKNINSQNDLLQISG